MATVIAPPNGDMIVHQGHTTVVQRCAPNSDLLTPYKVKEYTENGRKIILIFVPCRSA